MDGSSNSTSEHERIQDGSPLDRLTPGSTVLVACAGEPSRDAVDLRILCHYGAADGTALVVATTVGVDRTVETYDRLCPGTDRPSLGVVDTSSEQQSVSALYAGTPVVFTPSPGDLERMVLALSDLSGDARPSVGARHLVLRSLTPLLETTPTDRVCTVLERITGLRSGTGFCLLGIDYTAHDEETMTALAGQADGVLWVTRSAENRLEYEYHPTAGRHAH